MELLCKALFMLMICLEKSTSSPVSKKLLPIDVKENNNGISIFPEVTRTIKVRRVTPMMFRSESGNDTCTDSLEDFPNFLTRDVRKSGGVVIAIAVAIYCFTLLAILCDKYFLPCVERICETLNISQDVAAATFMASATSAPELFINVVGTFITQSDIGIGTVVGSSMFNTLGVAALGSLAAATPIAIDWWPVTRDCSLYMVAIALLVTITWDGVIFWYEALILLISYVLYFILMFNNKRIASFIRKLVKKCASKRTDQFAGKLFQNTRTNIYNIEQTNNNLNFGDKPKIEEKGKKDTLTFSKTSVYHVEGNKLENKEHESELIKLFTIPEGLAAKIFFFYSWPIKVILFCMLPNPKTLPKLFPITFLFCIILIGGNSYIISWMISVIGDTFGIADSVLGLTLLAAGGCLPEAISVIIMSRKNEGSMGVSNALGANTIAILLSLGLPWFVKAVAVGSGDAWGFITINSGSLVYTILGLILVALSLFLTLLLNQFRLQRKTGIALILVYLVFLSVAIVLEILFVDILPC